ncbi:DUF6204 family protein [Aquihabitans daechungensis]|uniref:DUF6204 family protein n=1 Tax=Aquihabitans daechungensis TaxID=1052257 RepID=UPI003B9DD241
MAVTVHRVVVRGHFADLTADQRASLLAEAGDHSFHTVAYTEWGTFIYEPNLVAFNFRYEVRIDDDADPAPDPLDVGLAKARASLAEWGLGHKYLKATATDMSQIWSG